MSDEQQNDELKIKDNVNIATCSWWSPWLEAAKLKSNEVFHFIKNDLNEISTVVKSEATSVITSTTSVFRDTFMLEDSNGRVNNVKQNVSSFFSAVSNAFNPVPEDEDVEVLTINNDIAVKLSPLQIKIHELIKNPDTFLLEIEESWLPQYNLWLEQIEDLLDINKLTRQLVASPELHKQYETLVPQHVSHVLFWKRFLFRKALLEDKELSQMAQQKEPKAEKVKWEKEDFSQCIELSEEEQIRILTEYEEEKKKQSYNDNKKTDSANNQETKVVNLQQNCKKDLVNNAESGSSLVNSADTEGKDIADDWEKDFELDVEIEE